MKSINAKVFTLKYKLFKTLEKSLNQDKNALKEGATLTYKDYCKIQITDCTKSTLDKDKVQELCNKYGIDISTLEKTTSYQRIDIDNVPTEVTDKIKDIFNTLEDSNDNIIATLPSKVNNIK